MVEVGVKLNWDEFREAIQNGLARKGAYAVNDSLLRANSRFDRGNASLRYH